MNPDINYPCEDNREEPCKVYPFKGINYTAEEINRLLAAVDRKVGIGMIRDGRSAYEVAVANGYTGNEQQWLASLRGPKFNFSDFTQAEKDELSKPSLDRVNERLEEITDTEDIASVATLDNPDFPKLQFADRPYNALKFSGKGYKILRKNIVDGKNILTQDMINKENTVYEIRYDFTVDGSSYEIALTHSKTFRNSTIYYSDAITIPANSVVILDKTCFFMWENAENSSNYRNVYFTGDNTTNLVIASLIEQETTSYKIQQKINIPANSTLLFNGGEIKNTGFTFNNTKLSGDIRFVNSYFEGNIVNRDIYMSWFENEDNLYPVGYTYQFFQSIKNNNRLYIGDRHIYVKASSFSQLNSLNIIGEGEKSIIEIEPTLFRKDWEGGIYFSNIDNIILDNIIFQAPSIPTTENNPLYAPICLGIYDTNNAEIKRCIFKNMPYIGPIGFARVKNLCIHGNQFYDYDSAIINNNTNDSDNDIFQIINIYNNYFGGSYSASEPITIQSAGLCHVFIHDNYIANKTRASGISIGNGSIALNEKSIYKIYNNIIENVETCIISFGGGITLIVENNYLKPSGTKHLDIRKNSNIVARNNIFAAERDIIQIVNQPETITTYAIFENNIFEGSGKFLMIGAKLICNNNTFKTDISITGCNEIEFCNNKAIQKVNCSISWNTDPIGDGKKIISKNSNIKFNLNLLQYTYNYKEEDVFEDIEALLSVLNYWDVYSKLTCASPIKVERLFLKEGQYINATVYNGKSYNSLYNLYDLTGKIKIIDSKPKIGQFLPQNKIELIFRKEGDYLYEVSNGKTYNQNVYYVTKNDFPKLYSKEDIDNGTILKENIIGLRIITEGIDFVMALEAVENTYYSTLSNLKEIDASIAKNKIFDFMEDYSVIEENETVKKYLDANENFTMPLFNDAYNYKSYDTDANQWLMPTGGYISIMYGFYHKINDALLYIDKTPIASNFGLMFLHQFKNQLDACLQISNSGLNRAFIGTKQFKTYPICILNNLQQITV